MKSLKRITLLLLVLLLTVISFTGCIDAKAYEATETKYFSYELLENGTYSIKAKDISNLPERLYIPEEIDGITVSTIEAEGFVAANITELCIPGNIKVVGDNAFNGCVNLSKLYIYRGVTTIGNGAFYGCVLIKNLNLPSTLKTIGNSAFVGLAITQLNLPEKVETIGELAFAYCASLVKVYIGHNVTEIGENAFYAISDAVEFEISASNETYKLVDGKPVKKS